jgi:hypothetical protein
MYKLNIIVIVSIIAASSALFVYMSAPIFAQENNMVNTSPQSHINQTMPFANASMLTTNNMVNSMSNNNHINQTMPFANASMLTTNNMVNSMSNNMTQ